MIDLQHYYRRSVEADQAFLANLVRQFGDPDTWDEEYRYDTKVMYLWDTDTLDSYIAFRLATVTLHRAWNLHRTEQVT